MKKSYIFFWYQEGFLNTYTQNIIWYNTNYVRKNNLFSYHIVCCSCSIDLKITDLMVNIMQKYGQKIKVNWQQFSINIYVRYLAIIVVQENIWNFWDTYFYLSLQWPLLFMWVFFYACLSLILLSSPGI